MSATICTDLVDRVKRAADRKTGLRLNSAEAFALAMILRITKARAVGKRLDDHMTEHPQREDAA